MSQLLRYLKPGATMVLLLLVALLAACGPATPVPSPRPTREQGAVAQVPPPTPTTPAAPTDTPVLQAADDGCVSCHTNQEQLVATAAEEEEVEALSEGEG